MTESENENDHFDLDHFDHFDQTESNFRLGSYKDANGQLALVTN